MAQRIKHTLDGTYKGAEKVLAKAPRSGKIGNNTMIARWNDNIVILLHNTAIVAYKPYPGGRETITLNSGGYRTTTTKSRMNECLPANVGVVQRNHDWFVEVKAPASEKRIKIPFFDGITLHVEHGLATLQGHDYSNSAESASRTSRRTLGARQTRPIVGGSQGTLSRLVREADTAARSHGHTMGRFQRLTAHSMRAACSACGMEAVVDARPGPNSIDIGGEAVAINCTGHGSSQRPGAMYRSPERGNLGNVEHHPGLQGPTGRSPERFMDQGKYPAQSFPGLYPLYYVTKDGGILCPECANENKSLTLDRHDPQWYIVGQEANYEDQVTCDHCGKDVPAAYADD